MAGITEWKRSRLNLHEVDILGIGTDMESEGSGRMLATKLPITLHEMDIHTRPRILDENEIRFILGALQEMELGKESALRILYYYQHTAVEILVDNVHDEMTG